MKGLLLKDIYNLKWLGICFAALAVILLILYSSNMDRSQFLNATMMFLALFCIIVPFVSMS
ncbi:MAG: hypothetical protein Q4B48_08715, partial [Syntrophomonadaceae bacterium]|nr:hypothetical protein [Syntrophomonadaceae bacterium]